MSEQMSEKKTASLPAASPRQVQRQQVLAAADKRLQVLGNQDPHWCYLQGFIQGLDWTPGTNAAGPEPPATD